MRAHLMIYRLPTCLLSVLWCRSWRDSKTSLLLSSPLFFLRSFILRRVFFSNCTAMKTDCTCSSGAAKQISEYYNNNNNRQQGLKFLPFPFALQTLQFQVDVNPDRLKFSLDCGLMKIDVLMLDERGRALCVRVLASNLMIWPAKRKKFQEKTE